MQDGMNPGASSLRLRLWASLLMFVSAYAPLLLILMVKDLGFNSGLPMPGHPWLFGSLLAVAVLSTTVALGAVRSVRSGMNVQLTKVSNRSGEMFGYTLPYAMSFVRIDLHDWQTLVSVGIFMAMMFVLAYRTQTVFVNPVLALAGYMQLDCTFKQGTNEIQAMVIARRPLRIGQTCKVERLSHYLYVAAEEPTEDRHGQGEA